MLKEFREFALKLPQKPWRARSEKPIFETAFSFPEGNRGSAATRCRKSSVRCMTERMPVGSRLAMDRDLGRTNSPNH